MNTIIITIATMYFQFIFLKAIGADNDNSDRILTLIALYFIAFVGLLLIGLSYKLYGQY
jgi:hypothetical protein